MVQVATEPTTHQHPPKGATIVLADVEDGDLANMAQFLTGSGYTVRSTHNADSAIETIVEISPDLILIDDNLPDGGGIEVCRYLKSQASLEEIPIVFVGPMEGTKEKCEAFEAGCADWIVKPVAKIELLVKVKTHLKLFAMVKTVASQSPPEQRIDTLDTNNRQLSKHHEHLEETVKAYSAQLTIAKEESKAANIAKSIFLSHMSHELRTPLNAILGFSRLMERDPNLTAKQAENLDLIHQSGEHLLNLIDDVLAMAKSDAGLEVPDTKAINLPQFVQGIAVLFNSRAIGHGLTFSLDMMPDMPRYVECDERKLQQILINLLDNSIKYTDTGSINLKVWSPAYDPALQAATPKTNSDTIELYFELRDSGRGIEPDILAKIFDPFFSGRTGGTAKTGTGLGLAISRNFARLMGGDISAANRRDKGAHFTCRIVVKLASKPVGEDHYRVTGIDSRKTGQRILVVDDNGTSRLLLSELLSGVGFKVKEAEDGRKAVALFFEWRPHLIFMDIRMPLMDGMAATKIIKATEEGKNVPIIALTAHAIEEERHNVIAAGCDAFIRKPFEENELFEAIARHLDLAFILKRTAQAQPPPPPQGPHHSVAALAELPASVLEELKQSSLELDLEKIDACIDHIQTADTVLGESLKALARRFRFNEIFKLTEQAIQAKN